MTGFFRQQGSLTCDGVPLADIAAAQGTPVYVYSAAVIAERYRAIDEAFASYPHSLHYALKANSTLAIARLLRSLGAGADANSGGEIDVALRAGFIPAQIVFTGVGKTPAELAQAIDLGVMTINAESPGEIERIEAIGSRARDPRASRAAGQSEYRREEPSAHLDRSQDQQVRHAARLGARISAAGSRHRRESRSSVSTFTSDRRSPTWNRCAVRAEAIVALARELRDVGVEIDHVDLGGGLGVSYDGSPVPSAREYADALLPVVRDSGLHLILEPGRNIIAPAGVLLSRVIDVKDQPGGKLFVILDAGMTELMRPMLYGAYHAIEPVETRIRPETPVRRRRAALREQRHAREGPRGCHGPRVGDLMAIRDTGAYAAVMASNYNRRGLSPEVLVDAASGARNVIRRRQTIDDILALEA